MTWGRRLAVATLVVATAMTVLVAPPASAADPTLTVTPADALLDGHVVTVTASGLIPGQPYTVTRCAGPDTDTQCADSYLVHVGFRSPPTVPSDVADVVARPDGTISLRLRLSRSFHVWRGELFPDPDGGYVGGPGTPVDCSVDACTIAVFAGTTVTGTRVAEAPITMAAEGRYVWPEAQLSLSTTTVQEGSSVSVSASGLSRWDGIPFAGDFHPIAPWQQCVATTGAEPDQDDCEPYPVLATRGVLDVRFDGTAGPTTVPILRHIDTPNGPVDCAVVGCTFAVYQSEVRTARVPLTFAPEWSPWPSVSHFLSQAVAPVRGRPLTNPERADLAGRLTARTTEGVDALIEAARAALAEPTNRHASLAEVVRTYQAFFGRAPEPPGARYWADRLRAGLSPNAMARAFGGTAEFRRTYDGLTNGQVVDRVYANTLGRSPDGEGREFWRLQLGGGLSRAGLVYRFGRSAEFRAREADRVVLAVIATVALDHVLTTLEWRWLHERDLDGTPFTLHEVVAHLLVGEDVP